MSFHTPLKSSRPALPNLPATPESNVLSSPINSFSSPTPSYWGTPAGGIWPQSSNFVNSESKSAEQARYAALQDSGKRGRPRADHISHLILEGTSSPSGIKCKVCNRIFPREKSLQVNICLRNKTPSRFIVLSRKFNFEFYHTNQLFGEFQMSLVHQLFFNTF